MARWQKNLFAILFGVILILLLEAALRLLDYHSRSCELGPFVSFDSQTPVLVDAEYQGRKVAGINPALKSYFNRIVFPREKSEATKRIFVLGGSDVMGFPFGDKGSFAQFLSLGLNRLDPAHHYQVINLGAFGYASYRVLSVMKDALNFAPDLFIVMSGHNEFLEKREYGSDTTWFRAQEKLSRLKIYCLVKSGVEKVRPMPSRPVLPVEVKWERLTMNPENKKKVTEHFQYNLDEMAALAKGKNLPILFITLPSNLRNFPPFHSEHKKNMNASELSEWKREFNEGKAMLEQGKFQQAHDSLKESVQVDPEYALGWYLLGQSLLGLRMVDTAKYSFETALEKDSWQVRALPEFNRIIRQIPSPAWVEDMVPAFDRNSPDGIPGDNLFWDHCHPKLEGQALIAREVLGLLNQKGWVGLPQNWETGYDALARQHLDSISPEEYADAYYWLALDIGVNMGLKDLGKPYLELGLKLDPAHPKLNKIAPKLR
jgi:tetratricopeptide (TPR) repeat protein